MGSSQSQTTLEAADAIVRERNKLLRNRFRQFLFSEQLADMKFHIEMDNVYIPAHRFLIGIASEVLRAQVYGDGKFPGTSKWRAIGMAALPVKNCSADEFREVS